MVWFWFAWTGRPQDELPPNNYIKNQYNLAQEAKWDKLQQTRLRLAKARKKFRDAGDNPDMDSYRLRFRIIDLDGNGLIEYNELWVYQISWNNYCEWRTIHCTDVLH